MRQNINLVSDNKYSSDFMQGELASIGVETALGRFDDYCSDNNIDLDRTYYGFKK